MKTKQSNIAAKFTSSVSNAVNYSRDKETIRQYTLVDKKTERVVVDCRVYMGRSRNASTVYAAVWVNISAAKKPDAWLYGETSGRGFASGYGYHKGSAAIGDAISSAGIELYGSPYTNTQGDKVDMKKRAHIGGCGDEAARAALLAIAYAAGFKDCIFV